jgi:hypothetical protein
MKIKLTKKGTNYFGEILSPLHRKRKFSYLITKNGIVEAS